MTSLPVGTTVYRREVGPSPGHLPAASGSVLEVFVGREKSTAGVLKEAQHGVGQGVARQLAVVPNDCKRPQKDSVE